MAAATTDRHDLGACSCGGQNVSSRDMSIHTSRPASIEDKKIVTCSASPCFRLYLHETSSHHRQLQLQLLAPVRILQQVLLTGRQVLVKE